MKIIELLKILLNKYLISTLLAVLFAIIVPVAMPNLFNLSASIGLNLYRLTIGISIFLLARLFETLIKQIRNKIEWTEAEQKRNEIETRKNLERVWSRIDLLTTEDRKMIINFLKNGNSPMRTNIIYGDSFWENEGFVYKAHSLSNGQYSMIMKLNENFYELLKYSYENYNRICHFDLED